MYHCNPCTTNYSPADRCPHCRASDYHEPNDGSDASRECPHCERIEDDEDDEDDDMAKLSKLGGLSDETVAGEAPADAPVVEGEAVEEAEPEEVEATAGATGGANDATIVAVDGPSPTPEAPTSNRKAAWFDYVVALCKALDFVTPPNLESESTSSLKTLAASLEEQLAGDGD